ncbi:ribosome biogenesis/translation initiation ATPase RLI [Candidatus Woesearchaeota archaeon]|jgi:ATP-binding cassette, sub-family E, member 1|nr:ribosome biogenesis/translation initiation ATPase RLI [Candidatus Woesearchaeota archaeon]MBT4150872.1 ribosome biogenesis/translation initiation ATPase RLI [Candidatus Woesearchaeota archaeon]MBT4246885.1 ribosome biogenesis/translation initiation ATPase RLI [Candidatus Woesearchaeota archaeon]MBT4433662.1 ribosome biogenesis/translation initiation ATPase RLI [Candidatus Woesearchaeota archaeon]
MKKRIAIIDKNKCHPQECGNYLCMKLCPVNRMGGDCITEGEIDKKAKIDEVLCTGCGICPTRCPYGAIQIINLPGTLTKSPVHRYGENMFELYSLPTPLFGKVTGILGKNGIGKSTAMKVMANILTPNLGDWKKDTDFKEVINYFKGTETQKFMEKLGKNEINLSYKPQQVDLIPKQFDGTVRELLTKVDAKNKLEEMAEKLELTNFLETHISKVSGGELQRVAIAACVLKEANLFLFDEPTSYLDIKQRINISKFIASLAKEDTSTIVIEHDLIILDYMTDLLNIMYGHEGAFGIVSGVKSTREGINSFLEGFLKEENVRFRPRAIKFETFKDVSTAIPVPLISWKNLSLTLGNFKFRTEEGTLNKGEVIGILGENGIGKTTFIKLLAGVHKLDSGELDSEVKVAYKPQYLDTESETLVAEYIHEAIAKYSAQLVNHLDLEKLFTQKLCDLSGGELQRVSIAKCLAEDAELFLLDEPSAYLDIEQRLAVSKLIKNVAAERDITILIVDHDLMFLDNLSHKLAVFTGVPAKEGLLRGPFSMEDGMNLFLKELGITLRRDVTSNRPRINKPHSVKDREQKSNGNWYYS